jgi:hypothetical protein
LFCCYSKSFKLFSAFSTSLSAFDISSLLPDYLAAEACFFAVFKAFFLCRRVPPSSTI